MTDSRNKKITRDWVTRTPKWALLGGFWVAQAVVLYLVQALLYVSQSEVVFQPPDSGAQVVRVVDSGLLGRWPSWDEYWRMLGNSEFALTMLITIGVLTVGQMLFVLPVRRPGLTRGKGHSLRSSLLTAGLVIGLLAAAAVMALGEAMRTAWEMDLGLVGYLPGGHYFVIGMAVALGWLAATPLLFRFSRPGRRETVLARLSKKLFIGTMIETALLIPLDVMVRRKTDCYCWAGSYWALTMCGFIGVFALGPAVFLPLLASRRKTWYAGHCGVCGYDMGGKIDAPRCPECGTGWKT